MIRSAILFMLVVFGFALQAQDRGTKDILSLSGHYGLPKRKECDFQRRNDLHPETDLQFRGAAVMKKELEVL